MKCRKNTTDRDTLDKSRRTQRPKVCDDNNKDEHNIPHVNIVNKSQQI